MRKFLCLYFASTFFQELKKARYFARVFQRNVEKNFSSGHEESEILSRKVGPRTCKGRELWSQNVADMHLRREKKHLRMRPLTAPCLFSFLHAYL